MKSIKFLICLVLTGITSYGQVCDALRHSIKSDNNIVLLTYTNGENPVVWGNGNLVITKLDENATTIWRQEYAIPNSGALPYRIYDATGDSYYVLTDFNENGQGEAFQLWKINKSNGNLIWRSTPFYSNDDMYRLYDLIDLNADTLILIEPIMGPGLGDADFKVHSISKTSPTYSGTMIYQSNQDVASYKFGKDSKGNLIFAYKIGNTSNTYAYIKKYNGSDFNTTLWEKDYYALTSSSQPRLNSIQSIFTDSADNLYAISDEDSMDIYKINSNDGSVIWRTKGITVDGIMTDHKFKDNYLYMSFRHKYIGSVVTSFELVKMNMSTGVLSWDNTVESTNLHMTPVGTPNPSTGTNEAIMSFDFDCNGDIYSTGYYGSQDYVPASWGIMKIDDIDGTKITDTTVYNHNNQIMDYMSVGLGAFVINNNPVFVGHLDYTTNDTRVRVIARTDLNLNIISLQAPCSILAVNDTEPQTSIQLCPNPTNGTVYFELKDNALLRSVKLYSIDGKELNSWYDINSVDLTNYPTGMYLVKMITNENEIVVKKIIKN